MATVVTVRDVPVREPISGYDSAYVALAEVRDLTLVTADTELAKVATCYCRLELV